MQNNLQNKTVEKNMHQALDDIQSGAFHNEWMDEAKLGYPILSKLRKDEKKLIIEEIGKVLMNKIYSNEVKVFFHYN